MQLNKLTIKKNDITNAQRIQILSSWNKFLQPTTYIKKNLYTNKYRGEVHSIYNLTCKTLRDINAVFHIGSNYDCKFIKFLKSLLLMFKKH